MHETTGDWSTTTTLSVAATNTVDAATTSFEPVLNVPALSVFLFIAIVFGFLQYRITAIGKAADRRTEALANLRQVRALQLSGGGDEISTTSTKTTMTTAAATDETTTTANKGNRMEERVRQATLEYEAAYNEVERLRTVIPGVARIIPPPAESSNRERMEENRLAAQQFLNVTLDDTTEDVDHEENEGLSPVAIGVLAIIATSQILLLLLLLTVDTTPSLSNPSPFTMGM